VSNSTRKGRSTKARNARLSKAELLEAARDYKRKNGIPLMVHTSLRWCRKIRGSLSYFGSVDRNAKDFGARAAMAVYADQRGDLEAGRVPNEHRDGLTIRDLLNSFLESKKAQRDRGELAPRTFKDYRYTTDRIHDTFGPGRLVEDLGPADFDKLAGVMAKTLGVLSRKTEIQKTKAVFNFAYAMELIDRPLRYGPAFKAPPKRAMLKARNGSNGAKMLEAAEIRRLLDAANHRMRAMILLGVNCGFGNHDVASLPLDALDLENGWVDHARPKTGHPRRCPLWPETVAALREAVANRKRPRDKADAHLVFLTQYGRPYIRLADKIGGGEDGRATIWTDGVCSSFAAMLRRVGLAKRGRGFYTLRHVFETIGGESIDQVAVNAIMGHADQSMAGQYRERISDARLRAVVEHVRQWFFGDDAGAEGGAA